MASLATLLPSGRLSWEEARRASTSTLQFLLRHRPCKGDTRDVWFTTTTKKGARRLCAGCPISNACFELAVREDVARNRDLQKITPYTRFRLFGVRGGLKASARHLHVLERLRALGVPFEAS